MQALVDEHTIHGALHALVEVCYRKAARVDDATFNLLSPPDTRRDNWRKIARMLTEIEATVAHMDL